MKYPNILTTSARGALLYVMKHFCEPGLTEYPEMTDTYVVISIQDTVRGGFGFELKQNQYCKDVLTLYFDDIERPQQGAQIMTTAQADQIVRFIHTHANDADTLLIHCFAGISRSKAVERFALEVYGMPPVSDHFCNEYVYTMLKQAWRAACIHSFAVFFLRKQDAMEKWTKRLEHAKYYHGILSENAVLVWNLTYAEAAEYASASQHCSFLFGAYQDHHVTAAYYQWSLLAKNKGRVRRAYLPSECCTGQTWHDPAFQEQFSEILRKYGISAEKLHDETEIMLSKLFHRQKELQYNNDSILTLLHRVSDDSYYAKGRYYARATLYHK